MLIFTFGFSSSYRATSSLEHGVLGIIRASGGRELISMVSPSADASPDAAFSPADAVLSELLLPQADRERAIAKSGLQALLPS